LAVFGKPRYLGLVNISDLAPRAGQWIVIKTVRGLEMGLLGGSLSQEQEAKYRASCLNEPGEEQTRGPEPILQEVEFVEPAGEAQVGEYYLCRSDEEAVLVRARQILKDHQLQMKLVDVEYTIDRRKLFFYFTSEQRIDFRAYVRDLAREFRIRIEMRQIGVRDEARTVRGISPCGRPCCCSYWLHRFTPINIRMVKEQNLALNPAKISGICGRLMCCMAYEHLTYNELWKSLPSPGAKIRTPQGNFVLEGVDLRSKTVLVRFPEGREVPIAIAEFSNFRETVMNGDSWDRDVPEDPAHRSPVSPGRSRPLSTRGTAPLANSHDSAARNGRKLKPEKISIEEHLAERLQPESRIEHKIERAAAYQPEDQPVPSAVERENFAGKRNRRRRGKTPAAPAGGPPGEGRPEQPAAGAAATQPSPRREQQLRGERPRPHEGRPIPQSEVSAGGDKSGAERSDGRARRRSRHRPSGEQTPGRPDETRKENT
jgi:cell fate regulator YaaT (PSP1 superfamily)